MASKGQSVTRLLPNANVSVSIGINKQTYSSIVQAKDASVPYDKVTDIFKRKVNPRKLKCGINRMTKLSNNTIRLEFDTEKERDIITDAVNKTDALKSEISKKKRPLIIVKGVQKEVPEKELLDAIVAQNETVANAINGDNIDAHIKIAFKRRNRNKHLDNFVIEVSGSRFRMKRRLTLCIRT